MSLIKLHKNHKDLDDEALLQQLKKTGDIIFFQYLFERYIPLVYGLCLKYLRSPDKSQDAVMDIYENLSSKILNYEIAIFKNWLYSVVKNHCFSILKESKKEIVVDFDSQLMESDSILTLFNEEVDDEKEHALNNCLQQLSEPQRICINKFFYENKSYADIVDETGYPLKSVKSYIQNGKRNLKNCIDNCLLE